MPLFLVWKIKLGLKIQLNERGNNWILYYKTNKEASTVLCSVVKRLGSELLSRSNAPCVSALQQNRAQSRLHYL